MMLDFPSDYFQDEYRNDFLVDATMKTVWAAELEVLNEVASVCASHDIPWFMAYGSLLGAVRHQGFIPWDDDIDIWMPREAYQRFLQVAEEELPKGFIVRGPRARGGSSQTQAYVNNADGISIEPMRLERFHGCPFYVGIDIFPLDDLADEPQRRELQRAVFSAAILLEQNQVGAGELRSLGGRLREEADITIPSEFFKPAMKEALKAKLWELATQMLPTENGREVAMAVDLLKYDKTYESGWFSETIYLLFEGFDVPVPAGYDAILRRIYGDYTVLVRGETKHDYPCYKRQLEELRALVADREGRA